MSQLWEKWQGHVVNGAFPLQRYLGASGHSGVFLTELPQRQPAAVAIKLVPAGQGDMALVDSQLARWRIASDLAHPHLLTLLDIGRCELDGLFCAYAVMEYADQTLAQLLLHRVLTEEEAREMLVPVLDALAFLHGRGFVHSGLKPTNILVVGEQLKLASDTVRMSGSTSTDIQGLGRTLVEALTRQAPPALSGGAKDTIAFPQDVSAEFREIIARCLSSRLEERPDVAALRDWIEGRSAQPLPPEITSPPSAPAPAPPSAPAPEPRVLATPVNPPPVQPPVPVARMEPPLPEQRVLDIGLEPSAREGRASFTVVATVVAAAVVLGWLAVHQIRKSHPATTPPTAAVVQASPDATAATVATEAPAASAAAAAVTQPDAAPAKASTAASAAPAGGSAAPSPLHEVIPPVPRSARDTIQGHVMVWVRVSIDRQGRVILVHADRPGPSRYFERLAVEAARKWTFAPADTASSRLMQVRFDFSRTGTTARAVTVP